MAKGGKSSIKVGKNLFEVANLVKILLALISNIRNGDNRTFWAQKCGTV